MTTTLRMPLCFAIALALGTLLFPADARASATYPDSLKNALGMPCAPPCTLCHQDNKGGYGTATKPFAQSMKNAGLFGASPSTLQPALDKLKADGTDSDSDGMPDIAELEQGRDPDVSGAGALCGPSYGCGARVAPRRASDGSGAAAVLAVWAALLVCIRWRLPNDGDRRN